jgi:aspartate-semialdehyde dehydrogenase
VTKNQWNVAVVGALGLVGREMMKTLQQRKFPVAEFRPLDQARFEGTEVEFNGSRYRSLTASKENFKDVDLAIFSAGGDASLELAPKAVEMGAVVVDNSSAWRMDPACPLVVPEVNPHDLTRHKGIIANPNCSTIQMVVALKPLHDFARIKRVVVSTYQAVSGGGKFGIDDLLEQTQAFAAGKELPNPRKFQYHIAFNLIPHIDVFQEGGYTKEEWKMVRETQKIMGDNTIKVTATCVRVPVLVGHSESVNIETEKKLTPEKARELLCKAPGVKLIDDPANKQYPMPKPAAGEDDVFVGRIREDFSVENGLNLWIVSDNVRKGAALNAIQIAEELVARNLVRVLESAKSSV